MDNNLGVRLAVQVNDGSWYVTNRLYRHSGTSTIHEDSINNLIWYDIYPSNYNTSKFNLVESEVGTSYEVLGVITNVGVYVYANNESLSSSPAAGFNGVSGSSTLVF